MCAAKAGDAETVTDTSKPAGKGSSWFATLSEGVQHDVHGVVETDADITKLHAHAELFDPRAESGFRFLQIFTACCNSFAHGANDVANAIGTPPAFLYACRQVERGALAALCRHQSGSL